MKISEYLLSIQRLITTSPEKRRKNILKCLESLSEINAILLNSLDDRNNHSNNVEIASTLIHALGETEAKFSNTIHKLDANYKALTFMKAMQPAKAEVKEIISGKRGLTWLRSAFWQIPEVGLQEMGELRLFREHILRIDEAIFVARQDIASAHKSNDFNRKLIRKQK